MKKEFRLKRNSDFQYIFKKGKSFANRQLVIYYMKRIENKHFRIGLSVGKKIGNAVTRNRIKRYLRQAFHELEKEIRQEYDIVIIARAQTREMNFHEVKKSLNHLLMKERILMKRRNRKR